MFGSVTDTHQGAQSCSASWSFPGPSWLAWWIFIKDARTREMEIKHFKDMTAAEIARHLIAMMLRRLSTLKV